MVLNQVQEIAKETAGLGPVQLTGFIVFNNINASAVEFAAELAMVHIAKSAVVIAVVISNNVVGDLPIPKFPEFIRTFPPATFKAYLVVNV
mgnify:CR=1 FL=1